MKNILNLSLVAFFCLIFLFCPNEVRASHARSCTFNNKTLASGQTATGYTTATVPAGSTCKSETVKCSNGTLTPSNAFGTCTVLPAATPTPTPAPTSTPVLTSESNRPTTSTYALNESVLITFTATGLNANQGATLSISILNEYGTSVASATITSASANASGVYTYVYTAPSSVLGYYEVHAQLSGSYMNTATLFTSGYGTRPSGFFTYAVVPAPTSHVDYGDTGSRFGMQGGFSSSAVVIPYLGVRYVIATNTTWSAFEPTYQTFVTNPITPQTPSTASAISGLTDALGNSWKTYFIATPTAGSIPAWASVNTSTSGSGTGPLSAEGTSDLPTFAQQVATDFASNYSNQTNRYFQMTWEPNLNWSGTPAQAVALYSAAYSKIHGANSLVAGPTFSSFNASNQSLLNEWITAGLAQSLDVFAFHAYCPGYPPEANGLHDASANQPNLLTAESSALNAAAGKTLPFYGSEHGFMSSPPAATWQAANWTSATQFGGTPLLKAQSDIRTTLIVLGEGGVFDFAYYVADYPNTTWTTTAVPLSQVAAYGFYYNLNYAIPYGTNKLGPKSIVPAYAAMTYLIDGSTSNGALTLPGTQVGYSFSRNNQTTYALWDYSTTSSYKTPAGTTSVCTWMGVCTPTAAGATIAITASPTYIITN